MILIVHSDKRKSRAFSDILYHMGVISHAISYDEVKDELSDVYRAVVVLDPQILTSLTELEDAVAACKEYIPTFAVSERLISDEVRSIFDAVICHDISACSVLEHIVELQCEKDLRTSTQYRAAGIDASCDADGVSVFDRSMPLTKTETMILRYLIGTYPHPKDADSIIRYAFKQLRAPEPASIRTHVSVINKKCREICARNLFLTIPGKGYVLATPEIAQLMHEESIAAIR